MKKLKVFDLSFLREHHVKKKQEGVIDGVKEGYTFRCSPNYEVCKKESCCYTRMSARISMRYVVQYCTGFLPYIPRTYLTERLSEGMKRKFNWKKV